MPGTLPPDPPASPAPAGGPAAPRGDEPIDASLLELSSSALMEEQEPQAGDGGASALIGKVISGRYQVGELLGQGGMGAVYRGEQVHLRKQVAIKLLRATARRLPELVARFEREAIAGAHVKHPNVVASIDFGQLDDQSYFLVLEFVEGTPLRAALDAGPLPALRALRVARQIASALEAVHAQGIVHRDLKPQNVMLDAQDQVKLIDFGLAKVRIELLSSVSRNARPAPALTGAGTVFGTLSYLAPEAIKGMDAVDARADLYALGIVMYEMLCGKHPFDAKDVVSLFKRQRTEDPPTLRERAPEVSVPPQVEAIVMRLIQREPASRYQTASEVVGAIDQALAELGGASQMFSPGSQMFSPTSQMLSPAMLAPQAAAPAASNAPPAALAPAAPPAALAPPPPVVPVAVRPRPAAPAWRLPAIILAAVVPLVVVVGVVLLVVRRPAPPPEEPAAAASAPAEPPPSAAEPPPAAPAQIDGLDAAGWGARLQKAAGVKNWIIGSKAVLALAELDPKLLVSPSLREEVVAVTAGIAFETNNETADQVFDVLTSKVGPEGLDVLFDIVRSRGGTKGGRRATEILSQPEVLERASPGLRITFELRRATCGKKRELLGRAAEEGDQRTLSELQVLHGTRCKSNRDPCCFREDQAMVDAIQKLKARLGQ